MSRARIIRKPIKVYSTDCKAVGIVAKYQFEEEQAKFRQERIDAKTKSWERLQNLVKLESQRLQLEKAGVI